MEQCVAGLNYRYFSKQTRIGINVFRSHMGSLLEPQCLFTEIADTAKAKKVAKTLLNDKMFWGRGIKTLSPDEKCYNPMRYHNGWVWPHDNALIAWGF